MRVKVRAVIPYEGRLVLARERRQGQERLTIPGAGPSRVRRWQTR